MTRPELLFTIGTGDGWNCHTVDGFGIRLDPVAGGEAWDWSAARSWWERCWDRTSRKRRDAAVQAALDWLVEAGLKI